MTQGKIHSLIRRTMMAAVAAFIPLIASAQIGEHRDDLSVGGGAGYVFSSINFQPRVSQGYHGGPIAGVAVRYVCEKYYSMICSVLAEVNYSSLGWKEKILDTHDNKVVNPQTGVPEEYSHTINYVQLPIFAHLAWGKEQKGLNFFFQAGPQFGLFLGESYEANFDISQPNLNERSNKTDRQYSMDVERTFDYGIAGGLGLEYSIPHLGHFLLEGRYYYGLGNIYNSSKRDFFGTSNHNAIAVKMTYLFDIKRTK